MIIEKNISYAKEIGEVFELVEGIVGAIKKKEDYSILLPKLVSAVEGVTEVDEEFEANRKAAIQTATFHVGGIVEALLPVKA